VRPVENGLACPSDRSNLFLALYGPRFKTLRQYFHRTPELEHVGIWEIAHIRPLPRTQRVVFCPVNGTVWRDCNDVAGRRFPFKLPYSRRNITEHPPRRTRSTASNKRSPSWRGLLLLPEDSWSSNPWVRPEHGAAVRQTRVARGSEAAGQSHPLREQQHRAPLEGGLCALHGLCALSFTTALPRRYKTSTSRCPRDRVSESRPAYR